MIKTCMIRPVRIRAGLGDPPKSFYTNSSESLNDILKHWQDRKSAGLYDFVNSMSLLVNEQRNQFARAYANASKILAVREPFQSVLLACNYFKMTKPDRLKFIRDCERSSMRALQHDDGNPVDVQTLLSVPSSELAKKIAPSTAENIWRIAATIHKDDAMTRIKTNKGRTSYSVCGTKELNHQVDVGTVKTCSTNKEQTLCQLFCTCTQYKHNQICSHTVAVAEKEGILGEFVSWFNKAARGTNLSSIATMDVNIDACGTKKGQARRKRQSVQSDTRLDPDNPEFEVVHVFGLLRRCQGCPKRKDGNDFDDDYQKMYLNLVVRSYERRSYIDPNTKELVDKPGFTYYHIRSQCIRRRHPTFDVRSLKIPREIDSELTAEQKALREFQMGMLI